MASNAKVFVTGAGGFVGSAVAREASDRGFEVIGAVRTIPDTRASSASVRYIAVGNIGPNSSWENCLSGIDVVIHCVARVHVMSDPLEDPLTAFREINCAATLNLARQAVRAGVKRFVFVSSVKVNGEKTDGRSGFREDEEPAPEDPYAISKREAEDALRALAQASGMAVVIVRPPLVYGPGVKGNFSNLLRIARLPVPLPFGAVDNRRSLIGLANLVDFILCVATHPNAANQTFLISDGEDLSTTQLFLNVRRLSSRKSWLVPVPSFCFELAGRLFRKGDVVRRICGSLQVDITKARNSLGWTPPYTVNEELSRAIESKQP